MRKKIIKRIGVSLLVIVAALALFILGCFINNRIQLKKEDALFIPTGQLVEVNGHNISVYSEGSGEQTIVFLSGAGTCSPILDFKSLYSLLSDNYRIAVVEKAGYGFSDDCDVPRDIDTVLSETRKALELARIPGPYVLCPHSMSGIEALYWAQQYPDEVTAIIGLDMSVPAAYESMEINLPIMQLASFAAHAGITRIIPSLAESDAIKYGTLSDEEKELYRAIFYRRTATKAMLNEAAEIKTSAEKVAVGTTVNVPMLMFVSNGSGGTGFDESTWRNFQNEFATSVPNAKVIELDCPHYVQDHAYNQIADEIGQFLLYAE
ncbi:MAG: alpha/beta hydrolase [Lachnospiraceae bacterium]|nr:alpha/beta hydrolase [Lachnospiraceae bacterium]